MGLPSVHQSIVAKGVKVVITSNFDSTYYTLIKEMFNLANNHFAQNFVLTLAIKSFLHKANWPKHSDQVRSGLRGYLKWKAKSMFHNLEDNIPPNITTP
jgi:hypothetical protein